jgi:hypothetical protein
VAQRFSAAINHSFDPASAAEVLPIVLHILTAGYFIDRDAEDNVIFDTRQLKTPLQYPMTMWKDPVAPHAVENPSETLTLHLVRMDMKK